MVSIPRSCVALEPSNASYRRCRIARMAERNGSAQGSSQVADRLIATARGQRSRRRPRSRRARRRARAFGRWTSSTESGPRDPSPVRIVSPGKSARARRRLRASGVECGSPSRGAGAACAHAHLRRGEEADARAVGVESRRTCGRVAEVACARARARREKVQRARRGLGEAIPRLTAPQESQACDEANGQFVQRARRRPGITGSPDREGVARQCD